MVDCVSKDFLPFALYDELPSYEGAGYDKYSGIEGKGVGAVRSRRGSSRAWEKPVVVKPAPPISSAISGPAAAKAAVLGPEKSETLPSVAPAPAVTDSSVIAAGSTLSQFHAALASIDLDDCDAHGENAFFVCDLGRVYAQYTRWQRELASHAIEPFYAIKCNPDPLVLRLFAGLGMGFDCASQPEIMTVLGLGIDPARVIYANPCKAASFIRHARQSGVDCMTFDNADELEKIKRFHPDARLVLRLLTDDSGSLCRLGLKFGAPLEAVPALLARASELALNVVGISFHVGSGCKSPEQFGAAVADARAAFDMGAAAGFTFDLLDVGGGFEDANFEAISAVLRRALDAHFPRGPTRPRVIAEPGRFFVSAAFELATNVIARRSSGDAPPMYYINDGVYGAFNCTMFDHQIVHPRVLTLQGALAEPDATHASLMPCSVWGPTCDSIDLVQNEALLPANLSVGDWLRWSDMGAYTICAASQFNGFRCAQIRYTIDAEQVGKEVDRSIRALIGL